MKEKGMTTINLKKFNRNKVYQYIYQQKETSKLQIVRDLQMGLSTVSQNLNELEQDGLICRNGYFESTGGRKAQIIRIVEDFRIGAGRELRLRPGRPGQCEGSGPHQRGILWTGNASERRGYHFFSRCPDFGHSALGCQIAQGHPKGHPGFRPGHQPPE